MAFPIYADEDVRGSLIAGLKRRGWDVVRAADIRPGEKDDELHLVEASARGRVLLTGDDDLLAIAGRWTADGRPFNGVIYCPQRRFKTATVGELLEVLNPSSLFSSVRYL